MDDENYNSMKGLIEKKAQEAREYFAQKYQRILEALPKEKQEEMRKHIQQFWPLDGESTEQ